MASSRSLLWIQVLRAVAALSITIAHTHGEFARNLDLADAIPSFTIAGAGVDLFFVISGFVIVYSSESLFGTRRGPRLFFLRRCARIVPLYWTATAILLGYVLFRYHDLAAAKSSMGAVIASFLFFPYPLLDGFISPLVGVGWTLNYEMFFYVVFAGAVLAPRRWAVLAVGLTFSLAVAAGILFAPLEQPFGYWFNPIILEFVFGMLIALAYREGPRVSPFAALSLIILGLVMLAALWVGSAVPRVVGFGVPAAVVVGGFVFLPQPSRQGVVWRSLHLLGDASYALYLLHPFVLASPRWLFPSLLDPAQSPWSYASVLVVLSVLAAVSVHLLLEKPLTKALQRWIATKYQDSKPVLGMRTVGGN